MQFEPPADRPPSRDPSALRFPLLVLLGFLVTVLVAALVLPRAAQHRRPQHMPAPASQKR
jgi:hypothetical protein